MSRYIHRYIAYRRHVFFAVTPASQPAFAATCQFRCRDDFFTPLTLRMLMMMRRAERAPYARLALRHERACRHYAIATPATFAWPRYAATPGVFAAIFRHAASPRVASPSAPLLLVDALFCFMLAYVMMSLRHCRDVAMRAARHVVFAMFNATCYYFMLLAISCRYAPAACRCR